ncbi:MAG: hypothetical protein JWR65_3818, partial [Massilia sp.]|nr:hypothetical protein [Massilia sp.]
MNIFQSEPDRFDARFAIAFAREEAANTGYLTQYLV